MDIQYIHNMYIHNNLSLSSEKVYANMCIHQLVTVLGNHISEKLKLKLVLCSGLVLWLGLEIQSGLGLALCLELQLGLDTGL